MDQKTTVVQELKLSVLIMRGDGGYYAQCLEHDIGAQGPNVREALHAFFLTLMEHLQLDAEEVQSIADVPPAPEVYWRKYNTGLAACAPEPSYNFTTPTPSYTPPAHVIRAVQEVRVY